MLPLMLGSLIYIFNWRLEDGVTPENMNMEDKFGIAIQKADSLKAHSYMKEEKEMHVEVSFYVNYVRRVVYL